MIELALAIFGGFVLLCMGIHELRFFLIRRVYAPRLKMTVSDFLKRRP